jgi:hypothetical protein
MKKLLNKIYLWWYRLNLKKIDLMDGDLYDLGFKRSPTLKGWVKDNLLIRDINVHLGMTVWVDNNNEIQMWKLK